MIYHNVKSGFEIVLERLNVLPGPANLRLEGEFRFDENDVSRRLIIDGQLRSEEDMMRFYQIELHWMSFTDLLSRCDVGCW
jgi:hypothetical protein